jgi:hypothetical protein
MSAEERRFRLGPRERRGLVAGWRPGQVLAAALGCAIAGALVACVGGLLGVFAGLAVVAGGVAAGTLPLRGRTIDEWAVPCARYLRSRRELSVLELELFDPGTPAGRPPVGGVLGAGAPVVVLRLACQGISLLDTDARQRLVGGLTHAVGLLAREGSAVDRAAFSLHASTDDGQQLARDLRRRGRGELEAPAASYRALLGSQRGRLPISTIDLVLQGRSDRGLRPEACRALLEEAEQVARALEDAGHPPARLLEPDELREELRRRCGAALSGDDGRLQLEGRLRFDRVELDDRLLRAWWVAEWPRHEVGAELLAPLLLAATPLSMAIVLEPVAPSAALRRAKVARTSGAADEELRRRGGFLGDRRRQREAEHLERREVELVDGHGSLRFSGFLAVAASDDEELGARSAAIELAAAQAGLRLQPCQGDHARGWTATLPLARGLR